MHGLSCIKPATHREVEGEGCNCAYGSVIIFMSENFCMHAHQRRLSPSSCATVYR